MNCIVDEASAERRGPDFDGQDGDDRGGENYEIGGEAKGGGARGAQVSEEGASAQNCGWVEFGAD